LSVLQHHPTAQQEDPPRLLRLPDVIRRTGKSKSGIYADDGFPKPVKLGPRAVAWVESEVEAWVTERIAVRDAEVE